MPVSVMRYCRKRPGGVGTDVKRAACTGSDQSDQRGEASSPTLLDRVEIVIDVSGESVPRICALPNAEIRVASSTLLVKVPVVASPGDSFESVAASPEPR